jgi:hypothetical protein
MNAQIAGGQRAHREHHQRQLNPPPGLMSADPFGHPLRPEEREKDHAEGVKRGQRRGDQPHHAQQRMLQHRMVDDLILAPESRQKRKARQGSRPDQHGDERYRHDPPQPAETADIDNSAHGVHHATRAEEQQRLEEGMREQVEDGRAGGKHPHAQEHVAQLADGGIGQDALHVVLHQGDGRGKQRRTAPDDRDQQHDRVRRRENQPAAHHHVDTGGDHRRGVNQRRHRRRTFHRIGQPDVKRELGALAHRPTKQQHRDVRQPLLNRIDQRGRLG